MSSVFSLILIVIITVSFSDIKHYQKIIKTKVFCILKNWPSYLSYPTQLAINREKSNVAFKHRKCVITNTEIITVSSRRNNPIFFLYNRGRSLREIINTISFYDYNIITFHMEILANLSWMLTLLSLEISELSISDETVYRYPCGISGVNFNNLLKIELSAG